MKIFLVRHGETDSNTKHRLMGQRVDEPLNEKGRRQAEGMAANLAEQKYDFIFSSPQKRAIETAELIVDSRNIPVVIKEELKERDFGSLSGKTWEEIDLETGAKAGGAAEKDFNQEYDYRPYGGESAEDVKGRFLKFIHELKENYKDKKILIIAHGGILRLSHFLFNQEKLKHIENTAIVECEI